MTFINILKGYSIILTNDAQKDLQKLPTNVIVIVKKKLAQLTQETHNLNILKLRG